MEEIIYLLGTMVIEAPVALLLLRKESWQRVLFVCIFVNMITHPIAWTFVSGGANWWIVEVCVALFEAFIFAILFPRIRWYAITIGVIINAFSAALGFLSRYVV